MPRIMTNTVTLNLTDNLTGDVVALTFLKPNAKMRNKYNNAAYQRKGKRVVTNTAIARVEFGQKILIGIREGDFLVNPIEHENFENLKDDMIFITDDQTPYLTISSDPKSKYYVTDWKEIVLKYADELLETGVSMLFDNPATLEEQDNDTEDQDIDTGEDAEKNSVRT